MALQSDGSWSEFDDVTVEAGAQIQQDMIVNVTSASLYLLAANKVRQKIKVICDDYWTGQFIELLPQQPLLW